MKLEIENLEEFIQMFRGKEQNHTVFVGQINNVTKEGITTITATMTMKFTGYGGEDLLAVYESVGSAVYPPEGWKENPEYKIMYEKRKEEFELLEKKVADKRKEWSNKLELKGFNVYQGVWFE